MPAEQKRVLSTPDACAYLNLSHDTLYRLARAGKLAPIRVSARRTVWPTENLDSYIASCPKAGSR